MREAPGETGAATATRRRVESILRDLEQALARAGQVASGKGEATPLITELRSHLRKLEQQGSELLDSQAALGIAAEQYQELYDSAPNGYLTLLEDASIRHINLTAASWLRRERDSLLGESWVRFIATESRPSFQALLSRTFTERTPQTGEFRLSLAQAANLEVFVQSRLGVSGKECQIVLTDITQRKHAERDLEASLIKYRTLFNSFPLGITVSDQAGRIVEANSIAQNLLGITKSEHLKRQIAGPEWRILRKDGTPMPPGEYASVRALRENEVVSNVEMGIVKSPRETTWLNVTAAPLPLPTGGVVITYGDISARIQAETVLRSSEQRLRQLYEDAPEAIILADAASGEILDCNEAFLRLFGYRREELIGQSQKVLHPPEPGEVTRSFAAHRSANGGTVQSVPILTKAGKTKQAEINAQVLHIAGRKVLQGFFRDVTELQRFQGERETSLKLLSLLNNTSHSLELISTLTGFLKEWTGCEAVGIRLREGEDFPYHETRGFPSEFVRAERNLCGRDPKGMIRRDEQGRAILECMCGYVLNGPPRVSRPFFTPNGSFWTNSTSELLATTPREDFPASLRGRCVAEGYESLALIPLRYGAETLGLLQINDHRKGRFDPELLAFLESLAQQIAIALAQRKAAAELRLSESRYRGLVETTLDLIWEIDATGRYVYVSPKIQDLLGFAPAEVIGQTVFALMPESEGQRLGRIYRELMENRKSFAGMEKVLRRKDGPLVILESSGVPILGTQGELLGYRGMDRDVTARKRLEEQLREAQKMEAIGQLAGGIAHDFNNILAATMMHLSLLESDPDLDANTRSTLKELESGAQRAAGLTRQLLAFSQRSVLCPKPLDLNDVVVNLLRVLTRLTGESIQLSFDSDNDLPAVDADLGMMEQVLMNLVVNARDAMPQGGRITISTSRILMDAAAAAGNPQRRPGDFVCLTVADTGEGMRAEILKRIFEPFFTTKEVGKGTGLGLPTVHGIVAQHKGWLEVESRVGAGTTFRLYLPALAVAVSSLPSLPQVGNLRRGKETILVVEDELKVRRLVAGVLNSLGYQVLQAANGLEAIKIWQLHGKQVDLLFTDMVMPEGMTGLELIEQLRKLRPGLKAVISSGYSSEMALAGTLEDSGILYLPKPYAAQALSDVVRSLLDANS